MTPEQINDLAAEIVQEIRGEAFDGDKWLGNQKAVAVAVAVLAQYEAKRAEQAATA